MNKHMRFFSLVFILILAASNIVTANATVGDEIEITTTADNLLTDGQCSLREAIRAVNTGASVDACIFTGKTSIHLPAGVYALSIAGPGEDANASGDLDLLASMTLVGDGAAQTVIDGSQLDRVLQVHPGVTAVISRVTIRDGRSPDGENRETDGGDGQAGGGIANAGSLTLQNSIVSGSQTGNGGTGTSDIIELGQGGNGGNGGGIFNSGMLVLQHSIVRNNGSGMGGQGGTASQSAASGGQGGGIYSTGRLVVEDTLLQGNRAGLGGESISPPFSLGGNGGSGGGIYSSGSLTLRGSTLAANIAGSGRAGGAKLFPGVGGQGGGLFSSGVASLNNSTITANQAGSGGDREFMEGGNGGDGGGIYNSGSMDANNLTISANLAGKSGTPGTGNHDGAGGGIATTSSFLLRNSILSNNVSTYFGADCTGGIESRGYNLVQRGDGCAFFGDLTGNLIGVDPMLLPLGDFGGPTLVMPLHLGSPAINAGSCSDIGGNPVAVDQRGVARPQGGGCDIGAVEVVFWRLFIPLVNRN